MRLENNLGFSYTMDRKNSNALHGPERGLVLPSAQCQNSKCRKEFRPKRHWQKFCSTKCRNDYWNAINSVKR